MSSGQLFWAIVGLILLECQHLKWIWLEYWTCGRCGKRNLDCACPERRLLKYL